MYDVRHCCAQAHLPAQTQTNGSAANSPGSSGSELGDRAEEGVALADEAAPAAACAALPAELCQEPEADAAQPAAESAWEECAAAAEHERAGENHDQLSLVLPSPKQRYDAASPQAFSLASPLGDISNHNSPAAQPPSSVFATPVAQKTPEYLTALSRYATPLTVASNASFPTPGAAEAYVQARSLHNIVCSCQYNGRHCVMTAAACRAGPGKRAGV